MTLKIIIFISIIILLYIVKFLIDRSKNFDDIISGTIQKRGLKLLKSEYPCLFKIGPFSKEEKEYQSRKTIDYVKSDKVYYRKIRLESKINGEINVWVQITVGENSNLVFIPSLKDLN